MDTGIDRIAAGHVYGYSMHDYDDSIATLLSSLEHVDSMHDRYWY